MSIKEAGRYANSLSKLQDKLAFIIVNGMNSKLYKEVEIHKKSEAYSEHLDETIETEHDDMVDAELSEALALLDEIVKEKVSLACEIQKAKRLISINIPGSELDLDLDTAIEYAKLLRDVSASVYLPLRSRKSSKRKIRGTGYAFNVEGNQSSYNYEVEVITSILFNNSEMTKKDKETRFLADTLSQEVDKEMSKELVNHSPKFNYLDSIQDVVAEFVLQER